MPVVSGVNTITDGLVFYVDPTNINTYSGVGTTAYNIIPGGINNFSLVNGVAYDLDRSGSFYFDGTNDYIPIGSLGSFYTQGTISFWIKFADVSASIRNPFSTNYGTTNNVNVLRFETAEVAGSLRAWLGDNSGSFSGLYYSNVSNNIWYNVVLTWNQSTTTVSGYLNGALDTSNSSWVRWPSTFANIGVGIGYSGRYFVGNIGIVQIYNRALSSTEILQNYNATKSRYNTTENIVTSGLVLNVDLGKSASYPGTGTTVYDVSGSGFVGTLISSPTFSSLNGGSLVFGGSSYITRSSALDTGQNFTVTAWIYPTALSGGGRNAVIGNAYPFLTDNGWYFCISNNNFGTFQSLMISLGQDNCIKISNSYVFQLNSWTYIAATVSGGGASIKLYANGVETSYGFSGGSARTLVYTNNEFNIGARYSASEKFVGNISQVQIYNTTLTAQEILQNYNATKSRYINVLPPVNDSSLVLNLDAGNRASFSGTGTTWVDLSNNNLRCSLINGPTYAGTGVSTYFSFDGSNDYVDIPSSLSVNASSFTYEAVFRITTGADGNSLFSLNYSSPSSGYLVRQTTGNNLIIYTNIGTEPSISSNSVISNNTIYHLTVVQSGGSCSIYFNGTLDKTASLANPVLTSSNPTFIGRRGLPIYGAQLLGNIYLTKLYNRALTAAEVLQNFNFYRSRYNI